jgi:hypothetical protein
MALTPRLKLAGELRNDVEPAGRRGTRQRVREGGLYSVIITGTWRLVRGPLRFVRRRQNLGGFAAALGGLDPGVFATMSDVWSGRSGRVRIPLGTL